MGLVLPVVERVGLAGRLLRRRYGLLQATPHPHLRRPDRAVGIRRSCPQRAIAPVHSFVSALRLLSRALARADAAPAGHPGGALWRPLLWHLHLWLAGRARSDLAVRRQGGVVASVPASAANGGGDRLSVLAPSREPGPPPKAKDQAFLDDAPSRRWRRGQPRR